MRNTVLENEAKVSIELTSYTDSIVVIIMTYGLPRLQDRDLNTRSLFPAIPFNLRTGACVGLVRSWITSAALNPHYSANNNVNLLPHRYRIRNAFLPCGLLHSVPSPPVPHRRSLI